uniref:Uncharacterized protein n=2 Tax=Ciona intestinalis TaxID=7719 RepID=H2XSI2_CIOIN
MFTLRVANRGILTCRHLNKVISRTDKCFGSETAPVVCISHYKGFHQSRSLWYGDNQDKSTEQPEQKVKKQKRKKKKAAQPTEDKKESDTTDKQPKLTVATKKKKVPGKKSKSKIETIVKEVASELHPGEDAEVERATSELELLNRMLQIEQSSTDDNDDGGGAQNVSSYLDNLKEEKQIEEKMHVKQVAKTLHSTETLNIFKNGSSTVKTAEDLNPDSSKWSAIDWHDKYFFDEVEKFKDMAPPSTQFDEVYRLMDQ